MLDERDELLITVASLYYEQNQNQQQIADRLGISRSSVSRMIKEARDRGIVEIYIHKPAYRDHSLEQALIDQYGLQDAYVHIVTGDKSDADILQAVGQLAAFAVNRLVDSLPNGACIGIAWGTGVYAAASQLQPKPEKSFNVVQILGSVGAPNTRVDGPDVARLVADKYNGQHHYLRAPALVAQKALRDLLYQEPAVRDGLQKAKEAELVISGIGTVVDEAASFLRTDNLSAGDLAELRAQGIVGETCGRFFDAWGRHEGYEINERIIGISPDDLRQIPRVIAVARGLPKARSILGALRGGLLTVLATDDVTARAVLELSRAADESSAPNSQTRALQPS